MDVILLPDALGHQPALTGAQRPPAAHRLTLPVLGHLHGEGRVDDAVAPQHLACREGGRKRLNTRLRPGHHVENMVSSTHQGSLPCRRPSPVCRKVESNIRKEAESGSWSASQPANQRSLSATRADINVSSWWNMALNPPLYLLYRPRGSSGEPLQEHRRDEPQVPGARPTTSPGTQTPKGCSPHETAHLYSPKSSNYSTKICL